MRNVANWRGILVVIAAALSISASPAESLSVLRGRLAMPASKPPASSKSLAFKTLDSENYTVSGDQFSMAQLQDPRLAGRVWELEGILQSDRDFEIHRLFTIKDGHRHRVTYYCVVCNIYTHEPGRCMCCQGTTELQEVPES